MMTEYEVDEATLRQDITAVVASMEQRGLIKRVAALEGNHAKALPVVFIPTFHQEAAL